jgi:hypothetical protein
MDGLDSSAVAEMSVFLSHRVCFWCFERVGEGALLAIDWLVYNNFSLDEKLVRACNIVVFSEVCSLQES